MSSTFYGVFYFLNNNIFFRLYPMYVRLNLNQNQYTNMRIPIIEKERIPTKILSFSIMSKKARGKSCDLNVKPLKAVSLKLFKSNFSTFSFKFSFDFFSFFFASCFFNNFRSSVNNFFSFF